MVFRRLLQPGLLRHIRFYSQKKGTEETMSSITSRSLKEPPTLQQPPSRNPEIFSRLGDNGTSKVISGEILQKDSQIFHAIGATEELLSYLGLAREFANESEQEYVDKLKRIQTIIIDISTAISRGIKITIPSNYTKELEDWIYEYSKQLPPPEQYIIPGGGIASASLHVARAICRKTERIITPLIREEKLDKEALIYLNRLSDFLFMVSRISAKHDRRAESIYIPKPDEKIQAQ